MNDNNNPEREIEVPLQNGKLAPYGSLEHVQDLEMRIQDLVRTRSYQTRGSESKRNIGQKINSLRAELRSAMRVHEKSNPSDIVENNQDFTFDKFINDIVQREEQLKRQNGEPQEQNTPQREYVKRYRELPQNRTKWE
jgi:hypothetical protein